MPRSFFSLLLPCALILCEGCSSSESSESVPYEPTSTYTSEELAGFTVLFSSQIDPESSDYEQARTMLETKLEELTDLLPTNRVTSLRSVRFWVERERDPSLGMVYHPSADWLQDNDMNPDKAKSIEIPTLANFLQWAATDQPMIVLHELSHAYHDQTSSASDPLIQAAYENALANGLYRNVEYVNGGTQDAYALTNHGEYFAELSEAYFGTNDFFPFHKEELQAYDPKGFETVAQIWGNQDGESTRRISASNQQVSERP